jgi:hypothetical protein
MTDIAAEWILLSYVDVLKVAVVIPVYLQRVVRCEMWTRSFAVYHLFDAAVSQHAGVLPNPLVQAVCGVERGSVLSHHHPYYLPGQIRCEYSIQQADL